MHGIVAPRRAAGRAADHARYTRQRFNLQAPDGLARHSGAPLPSAGRAHARSRPSRRAAARPEEPASRGRRGLPQRSRASAGRHRRRRPARGRDRRGNGRPRARHHARGDALLSQCRRGGDAVARRSRRGRSAPRVAAARDDRLRWLPRREPRPLRARARRRDDGLGRDGAWPAGLEPAFRERPLHPGDRDARLLARARHDARRRCAAARSSPLGWAGHTRAGNALVRGRHGAHRGAPRRLARRRARAPARASARAQAPAPPRRRRGSSWFAPWPRASSRRWSC